MKCRHCAEELTLQMVDLGASPPSNAFNASQDAREKHYPLRVLVCTNCWLVQTDINLFELDHDELFTDDYPYFSSTSAGWVKHAKEFVERFSKTSNGKTSGLTVEVGANDGYLLQHVLGPCYGVEPTKTGEKAEAKGIQIYREFFGTEFAKRHAIDQPDLMICNNVLAHVPDINDFVQGFAIMLSPKGLASFEFPHLLNLVQQTQFDTIYHEHYSYLSLSAVKRIFEANGLRIVDVEKLETHGGSLRVFAKRNDYPAYMGEISPSVQSMLDVEIAAGIETPEFYQGFQGRVDGIKDEFVAFLMRAKRMGLKVAGFGAAAKGNTFLNYAGIRADLLPYVVDDTPAKQGKFLPGSRIPVFDSFKDCPDYVFILPWNFKSEIMEKLAFIREWGGKFVTAIPRLEIL